MLQNSPTSRFLVESRRTTCTQRNTIRLSIAGISPLPSRGPRKSSGLMQRAVVVAQPRQRLVVAHLALRQRDDRLEDRGRRGWLRPRARSAPRSRSRSMPRNGPRRPACAARSALGSAARPQPAARAAPGASAGAAGRGRGGVALAIALSSICSCAATASARSFTSPPSSSISEASGSVAERVRSMRGGDLAFHRRRGGGRARRPGGRCRRCRARGRRSAPPMS